MLLIIILQSIVYIYEWRKLNTFTFRVCELLLSRKTNGDLKRFQPIVEGREGGGDDESSEETAIFLRHVLLSYREAGKLSLCKKIISQG